MSDANELKFSLKVMINKQKNKVLFAEADNDFADLLLSFLTLPLGRIVKILKGHNRDNPLIIGSLTTLYKGLTNLNGVHIWENDKALLLSPIRLSGRERVELKLSVEYPQTKIKRPRHASLLSETPFTNDGDGDGDGDGFTVKSASFIITNDLRIEPVVPGSILQTLRNHGINETDEAELRTLTLGFNEIVDLLEGSLISDTPLTDLLFSERGKMDCVREKSLQQQVSNEESSSSSKKMTVKAMIHKSKNKILFVEAEDDFVDFLCSFLTIPLGAVECLLDGNTCLKNIDNLYRSIANIDGDKYFKSKDTEAMLLKPQMCKSYTSHSHFLPLIEKGLSTSKRDDVYGGGGRKYVKEKLMFNVTDDLVVTPFCMASSFSLLNRLKIPLSDVNEVELVIGLDEGLRILKASLTSTTALTDGLMNYISTEQPKCCNFNLSSVIDLQV